MLSNPNDSIEEEPQSVRAELVSMLSERIQQYVFDIPDEVWALNELELEKEYSPTTVDFMLRKNIWRIFKENKKNGVSHIDAIQIYGGVCAKQSFFVGLANHTRLAWILIEPQNLEAMIEESFLFGLRRMRHEVLTMSLNDKNIGHFLKAVEFLANRALGPMVQRIESKNLNLNVGSGVPSIDAPQTRDAIEAKLLELQQMVKQQNESKLIEASKSIEDS